MVRNERRAAVLHSQVTCIFVATPGEITYVTVLGKPVVILNTLEAAKELLEKRGATASMITRADATVTYIPRTRTAPFRSLLEATRKTRRRRSQRIMNVTG